MLCNGELPDPIELKTHREFVRSVLDAQLRAHLADDETHLLLLSDVMRVLAPIRLQ